MVQEVHGWFGPKYPSILNVYVRDQETKRVRHGVYSMPEYRLIREWIMTEKVDGCNVRVMYDGLWGRVDYRLRSDNADPVPPELLSFLQEHLPYEKLASVFGEKKVCLYGEGFGPKIQRGERYSGRQMFILFDIRTPSSWWCYADVCQIADKLGIPCVPSYGSVASLLDAVAFVKSQPQSLVALRYSTNPENRVVAEGVVARPMFELLNHRGERIITKIKVRDFAHES